MHEHIFLDLRVDVWLNDRLLADKDLAYSELMLFKQSGGSTIVDQTNGGLRGKNILNDKHPVAIREISQKTGINIILGSGWYRQPYYHSNLWRLKTDEICEQSEIQIRLGVRLLMVDLEKGICEFEESDYEKEDAEQAPDGHLEY